MSTRPPSLSLTADRRASAPSRQSLSGLEVRGPISRAVTEAGVLVPRDVPTPPASAPLSGLTADERRVHRILLDSLAMQYQQLETGHLSYVERKKLEDLDLAFIDAEIQKMNRGGEFSTTVAKWTAVAGFAVLALVLLIVGLTGTPLFEVALWGLGGAMAVGICAMVAGSTTLVPSSPHRKKIYHALRELALFAHPDDLPVSDALRQADLVIDRLAGADEPSVATNRRRLRA